MQQTAIVFGARPAAVAVWPSAANSAVDVLSALALPPHQAVLVVLGAADSLPERLVPKLTRLFRHEVVAAARETNALLLDGGTQAGIMALLGESVASSGHHLPLLGVAPAGQVTFPGGPATGTPLEPNHSHFVLAESAQWGGETALLYHLLEELATPAGGNIPVVVLLVGGGTVARTEIVQAVRHRLPIVVVTGSGGLADELTVSSAQPIPPPDVSIVEIIADGQLTFYNLHSAAAGLGQLLERALGADPVLLQAWETFADYDTNANLQQKRFSRLQQTVIWLGLVGTALAIVQQLYAPKEGSTNQLMTTTNLLPNKQVGWWLLHQALLLIPIVLTVLVTATNRFKQGTKWLLLRAGAEAIRREIYRYRTRAGCYQQDAGLQLAQRLEEITRRTIGTEVSTSAVAAAHRPGQATCGDPTSADDGLSLLTPTRYVAVRLSSQLTYFRRKAEQLEKQLQIISWLTFIVGGVGTYLAAVGQQVWLALTTALIAALGTYLSYRQTERTLTKYNQAATGLANVRTWWQALTPTQQAFQINLDLLVEHTEQVLEAEQDGWVQHMQTALAELHKAPPASPAASAAYYAAPLAKLPAAQPVQGPPAAGSPTPAVSLPELEEAAFTAEAALPSEDSFDESTTEVLLTAEAASTAWSTDEREAKHEK